MALPQWVKLPTAWVEDGRLAELKWNRGDGSNNVSALMVLAVAAHHMRPENGVARLTYDELCEKTSLSRAKVADGLAVLQDMELLEREPEGRSTLKVANYDPAGGWAKFPAKGLYRNGVVAAFSEFRLRHPAELDALKLYYLFASRRDRQSNAAHITYEQISEYTDIPYQNIRRGLSILAANGLIHVEQVQSAQSKYGIANAYRLPQIDPRRHRGTIGRDDSAFFAMDDEF